MERAFFSPESERSMIEHMNEEHADAPLMYAKVYGHLWSATAARMVTLAKEGMDEDRDDPQCLGKAPHPR